MSIILILINGILQSYNRANRLCLSSLHFISKQIKAVGVLKHKPLRITKPLDIDCDRRELPCHSASFIYLLVTGITLTENTATY